ncbi:MAG: phycobiliprotein lyase [Synechococcus sp.]|nr:phycobiliprotein lyase [Synechococcus sp.]
MHLAIPDALSFFQRSCGRWRSQRSVHHLLHRRAEAGGSLIVVEDLEATDERLRAMAEQQGHDPNQLIGGSFVRWSASMAWDQDGDAHDGESVIGLIPDSADGRTGVLLRDLGYAEKAPATSTFAMDAQDGLVLRTEYETMTVWERFGFAGPDVRVRSSTVEGLSNNASFCIETRLGDAGQAPANGGTRQVPNIRSLSPLGW